MVKLILATFCWSAGLLTMIGIKGECSRKYPSLRYSCNRGSGSRTVIRSSQKEGGGGGWGSTLTGETTIPIPIVRAVLINFHHLRPPPWNFLTDIQCAYYPLIHHLQLPSPMKNVPSNNPVQLTSSTTNLLNSLFITTVFKLFMNPAENRLSGVI